jgi:hypothetical protein
MEATTVALLVLIPLLVWRIYFRLKGLLGGRRQSHLWRHLAPAILWPALIAAAAWHVKADLLALSSLGAGVLAGVWISRWSMRLTRLENSAQGRFYTPDLRHGMTVTMLFIARLLYGALDLYIDNRAALPAPGGEFLRAPLSLLAFGLMAAYYAAYGYGLLRWRLGERTLAERQCD